MMFYIPLYAHHCNLLLHGAMDESDFLRDYPSNLHFCAKEKQRYTSQSTSERERYTKSISKSNTTFVHFFVYFESHCAAAQIIITPFRIESLPKQTFYKSKYRYTKCCHERLDGMEIVIKNVVQRVYAQYEPIPWDFSASYW